jgi:hypothetical protein
MATFASFMDNEQERQEWIYVEFRGNQTSRHSIRHEHTRIVQRFVVIVLVAESLFVSDSLDLQELLQSPLSVEAALNLLSV